MLEAAKGSVLYSDSIHLSEDRVRALTKALGTSTASETAALVPFFAPTVGGEGTVVDGLGLDLSRALLGSLSYEWERPFAVGEDVHVTISVADVYTKGRNQFGLVAAEFRDRDGELIQRQTTTFVERTPS